MIDFLVLFKSHFGGEGSPRPRTPCPRQRSVTCVFKGIVVVLRTIYCAVCPFRPSCWAGAFHSRVAPG